MVWGVRPGRPAPGPGRRSLPSGTLSGAARVPVVSEPGGEAGSRAEDKEEGPRPASH